MSNFQISIPDGESKRLLTGGKYCPADIVVTASAENCNSRHFTAEFMGNGQGSYVINVPFEPDAIALFGWEPTLLVGSSNIALCNIDLRAFGLGAGVYYVQNTGTDFAGALMTTKTYKNRYSRAENGDVTLQGMNITTPFKASGVFGSNIKYKLVAVKYTDKTDKARITDFVNSLPSGSSGSVTMNQEKVNAAFTTAEWSALIATKPSWTFAMF
jgi:hypothetical protein